MAYSEKKGSDLVQARLIWGQPPSAVRPSERSTGFFRHLRKPATYRHAPRSAGNRSPHCLREGTPAPTRYPSDLRERVLQHHLHLAVARHSRVAHVEHQIVARVQHEGPSHRNMPGSRRRSPIRRHPSLQNDTVENVLQKVAVVAHA